MTVRILVGDCLDRLAALPDGSVHCCVTSPPYFGLRDYGTAVWSAGDPNCDHVRLKRGQSSTIDGGQYQSREVYRDECGKCGAARIDRQIGLEDTPEAFVGRLVEVFREVRRVLRDDGTLWLNIGDSYASNAGGKAGDTIGTDGYVRNNRRERLRQTRPAGDAIKAKDLIGVPWMLAFALRADGWFLRQDIIWSKPNPMPESVRDRCTKAHEYLFLLSKSPRYYFDQDAIAEVAATAGQAVKMADGWDTGAGAHGAFHRGGRQRGEYLGVVQSETRNRRSVWEISTQPFKEAHFATFPPALVEPCILAACPAGGTVLDPFGGAGTTGLVADRLQRDAVLIELNPEYAAIAERRIHGDASLLAQVEAA